MRTLSLLLMAAGVALLAGCYQTYETDEQYTLNPDGSGKVTIDAKMTPMGFDSGEGKADPAALAKKTAKELLEKSEGVTAWKDVSFGPEKDGRVHFRGTAYFKDLGKLAFNNLGLLKYQWKAQNGTGVLSLKMENKGNAAAGEKSAKPTTEDEIKAQMLEQRMRYQQSKPMMAAMLGSMKTAAHFKLPGTVGEAAGFAKGAAADEASISMSGGQILSVMDQMMQDDAVLHDQVAKGEDVMGGGAAGKPSEALWLKLFGTKGEPQVAVAGLKAQFDYAAEVAAAKKAYPVALEKIGLAENVAQAAPAGAGLTLVTVTGVKIAWSDASDLEDDNGRKHMSGERSNYTLDLAGKFAGTVFKVDGGRVDTALTDTGEELVEQNGHDFHPFLRPHFENGKSEGGQVFTGDIRLALPSDTATVIKELSGKVFYSVVGKKKMLNLGLTEFKAGAKGTEFAAEIESIGKSPWGEGKTLTLKLSNLPETIGEIKFYDEDGSVLALQRTGSSTSNNSGTYTFTRNEGFPAKGRIEIEVYDDVKKLEAPFKLENIPLVGKPVKPKA
jgi:hypothetical protein